MPSLALLPDAERLVSAFLRSHSRLAPLVGERVYTVFPGKAGAAALLLVQRIGGSPPFSQPLVFDQADLQLSAYGGSKHEASELAATARAVLTELEDFTSPEGSVSAVRFGLYRWQPDETYNPPRPRFVFDASVYVRPPAELASSTARAPEPELAHSLPG